MESKSLDNKKVRLTSKDSTKTKLVDLGAIRKADALTSLSARVNIFCKHKFTMQIGPIYANS